MWLTALPLHVRQDCVDEVDCFLRMERNRIEAVICELTINLDSSYILFIELVRLFGLSSSLAIAT